MRQHDEPTVRPFVVPLLGQSNILGMDPGGPKAVGPNIFMTNARDRPTGIVRAAFGVAPLDRADGGAPASTPGTAFNNLGVAFANAVRSSGHIGPDRPIVLMWCADGALSISNWIDRAPHDMWARLLRQIDLVEEIYPGFSFDHVIWGQGENDGYGPYGSAAAYGAGFARLRAMLRDLPQWAARTGMSVSELPRWCPRASASRSFGLRNDFIRTLAGRAAYEDVDTASSEGCVESLVSPGPHHDGASLGLLGRRHAALWAERHQARRTAPSGLRPPSRAAGPSVGAQV